IALAIELELDRAGGAEVATVFFEDVADFGSGAMRVIGQRFDDDRHAARTIPFICDFFVRGPFELAAASLDGALDGVLRHVVVLGLVDRGAQPGVAVDVSPASASSNRHFLDQAREEFSALCVRSTLLLLYGA